MKNLNKPLENGLIPIVEIAKIIFNDGDMDFENPEFRDGKLLVSICGNKNGCGVTEYLYFHNNQFKLKVYDSYFSSDMDKIYSEPIEYDPIKLIKKLVELGVTTYNELGLYE